MISDDKFRGLSEQEIAWLHRLNQRTLRCLLFTEEQINNIHSLPIAVFTKCPDFEELGIPKEHLFLSGISLRRLKTCIEINSFSRDNMYYIRILDIINYVSTYSQEIQNINDFRDRYLVLSLSNETITSLNLREKIWLSRCPISSLFKIGFNENQVAYILVYASLGNPAEIPSFLEFHIHKDAILTCGIPYTFIKEGIYEKYPSFIMPEYYLYLVSKAAATTDITEPQVLSESVIVPESTSGNCCEEDEERGVVYVSYNNGIETRETAHDLSVKYTGCYGFYQDIIIKVIGIESWDNDIRVSFVPITPKGESTKQFCRYISPDFNFSLPNLGMINSDFDVFYIERLHKRSSPTRYRKGLMPDALDYKQLCWFEMRTLKKENISNIVSSDSRLFYKIAEYVFKPTFFTYKESLTSVLNADRLAAAFSSAYAIKIDFKLNRVLLLRYNYIIGTYSIRYNKWQMLTTAFNKSLKELGVPL